MKLKHIIFTILILIVTLLIGETTVMADFIQTKTALKYDGSSVNYNSSYPIEYGSVDFNNQWYESQNVFCIEAGSSNPTNRVGDEYTVYKASETITDDKIHKTLYIYAQLSESGDRAYNWDVVEQHAIWTIWGTTNYKSHSGSTHSGTVCTEHNYCTSWGKDYYTCYRDGTNEGGFREVCYRCDQKRVFDAKESTINEIVEKANVYYEFVKANGNLSDVYINLNDAQLNGNKYGPIKIDNYKQNFEIDGHTYNYDGVKTITIGDVEYQFEVNGNEFYVKNVNTDIIGKEIKVSLQGLVKEESYIVKVTRPSEQDYLIGGAEFDTISVSAIIGKPIEFSVSKTDESGSKLAGVNMAFVAYKANGTTLQSINYNMKASVDGTEILYTSYDSEGWIPFTTKDPESNIIKISPEDQNISEIYIAIKEKAAPEGYKKLTPYIMLKFTKNSNNEWERDNSFGVKDGIHAGTWVNGSGVKFAQDGNGIDNYEALQQEINEMVSCSENALTVINKKEAIDINLVKTDIAGVTISGAEFAYAVYTEENGSLKSIDNLKCSEEICTESDWVEQNGSGWRVLDNVGEKSIRISNLPPKDIYIVFRETGVPTGYIKILEDGYHVALKYEYDASSGKWNSCKLGKAKWGEAGYVFEEEASLDTYFAKYNPVTKELKIKNNGDSLFYIKKTDYSNNQPLKDVEFEYWIYDIGSISGIENVVAQSAKQHEASIKTNSEGNIVVDLKENFPDDVKKIAVIVHEKTAPNGYEDITNIYKYLEFELKEGKWQCVDDSKKTYKHDNGTSTWEIISNADYIEFKKESKTLYVKNKKANELILEILKTDEENGENLGNIQFKIEVSSGTEETSTVYRTTGSSGEEKGYIKLPIDLSGKEQIKVKITETSAPGYKLLTTPIEIKIKKDASGNWKKDSVNSGSGLVSAEISDKKLLVKIENEKDDNQDLTLILKKTKENGDQLYGAVFEVSIDNGKFTNYGNVSSKSVNIGSATFEILPTAETATVTIKETSAPYGYALDSTEYTYTIRKSGDLWIWEDNRNTTLNVSITNAPLTIEEVSQDQIKGTVYLDGYAGSKVISNPDGKYGSEDDPIKGVIVKLMEGDDVKSTYTTGDDGQYILNVPDRNKTYTVVFEYDGINYEATTYDVGSPVTEVDRNTFNSKFNTIKKNESYNISNEKEKDLSYFEHGESNENPVYDGNTWILKTLNYGDNTVKDDFKMTASTTYCLQELTQYHHMTWRHYHSGCWYETFYDDEKKPTGGTWHHYEYDDCLDYRTWFENKNVGHTDTHSSKLYYEDPIINYYLKAIVDGDTNVRENGDYKNVWLYHNEYASKIDRNNQHTVYRLDFGLLKREVDLSLVNDLSTVEVKINGKTTTYEYDGIPLLNEELELDSTEIGSECSDDREDYELKLTPNDFLYGSYQDVNRGPFTIDAIDEKEGFNNSSSYQSDVDKLKITATYRVTLNNQSNTNGITVNSIAYYYDAKYAFSGAFKGNSSSPISLTTSEPTDVEIEGKNYKKIDITGLDIPLGSGGQYDKIFITLTMNEETGTRQIKRETYYNTIAEITSYSTAEGKVDIDSAPGNALYNYSAGNGYSLWYEDDTDEAPGLYLGEEEYARTISGRVWHDKRTEEAKTEINDKTYKYGDGVYEGEDLYNGIIVQLIEVKDEEYYLWHETVTAGGTYSFKNVIPGDYIVRFIYNRMDNNGIDLKSTTDYFYTEEWYNTDHLSYNNISAARDNEARRLDLIAETTKIGKTLGTALKEGTNNNYIFADTSRINVAVAFESREEAKSIGDKPETVDGKCPHNDIDKRYHLDQINLGLEERPKTAIELQKHLTGLRVTANDGTTVVDAEFLKEEGGSVKFTPSSIVKGLQSFYATREKRNRWHLESDIEEALAGATLELIYTYTVTNVGEMDYISTFLAEHFENLDIINIEANDTTYSPTSYPESYNKILKMKAQEVRDNIKSNNGYNSIIGTYLGSVYYKPILDFNRKIANEDVSVVKTHIGKIEDYVNNDLKFVKVKSSEFIENKTIQEHRDSGLTNEQINALEEEYRDKQDNYNVIVIGPPDPSTGKATLLEKTEEINTVVVSKYDIGSLAPGESRTRTLILESNGKLTSTGVHTFPSNIAQIKTAYSNAVGRRDPFSIPGNLKYISIPETASLSKKQADFTSGDWVGYVVDNPTTKTVDSTLNLSPYEAHIEPDTYWAETVEITKPTGEDKIQNIALAISIAAGIALVGIGTFAIKKYVL